MSSASCSVFGDYSWHMALEHTQVALQLPSGQAQAHIWTTGTTSQRQPLLFIHGFRGDHHGLQFIAENVRGRQSFIPDLPGFGQTPPLPGKQTLETYTSFVRGLVDWIKEKTGQQPVLVGHSFGSIVAAHAAAAAERARGAAIVGAEGGNPLVLINPIVSLPDRGPGRLLTVTVDNYYRIAEAAPEKIGNFLLKNRPTVRLMSEAMATSRDRDTRRFIHDQHQQHFSSFSDRKSLADAYRVSTHHTVREVEKQLTMPVLVISGRADAIASPRATRAFVKRLPNVEHHEFPRVGHLVHYERPTETARLIENWLD